MNDADDARRLRRRNAEVARQADDARSAAQPTGEAERLREELRDVSLRYLESQRAGRAVERERRIAESRLAAARAYIARAQPALHEARILLASIQSSKFWQLRNAWFALKQRLRLSPIGPQPFWVPPVDERDDVWKHDEAYASWLLDNRPRASDLRRMRDVLPVLALRPTFSVLMPAYETPERYLRAAIDSVLAQAYPDWELIVADDASPSPHVRRVLDEYAAADLRIKPFFRERNGHIAASSNTALEHATGEFVALLDHDDELTADALFESALAVNRRPDVDVIYSDEDKIDEHGRRSDPYFKPDWSPESLLARNYVSHLGVYRRALVEAAGGFRVGFEGSQDYDLILRVSERTDRIEHIPRVLYHWRIHPHSAASAPDQKPYATDAAMRALRDALVRRGDEGEVTLAAGLPGAYTIRYALHAAGRVSIVVPTRDHGEDVDRCLTSIFERSTYRDFEVVLLDNGSSDRDSLRTFAAWLEREPSRMRLVPFDVPFNFSRVNNHAARHATGTYLLFLNNDTEVVTSDWLEAMVEQAQRPPIGAVGAKLLYPDGTVQHGGVILGIGGVAGHAHKYMDAQQPGYFSMLQTVNNFSAVTGACMMVRRDVFDEVGGFDEELAIAFNDIDFCLRVRAAGYRNLYVPHAVLYHYESKSRGAEDTPEKIARFHAEAGVMRRRWRTDTLPDPYYNPNLTLIEEDFGIA